jgi:hypothetical protein
MGLLHGRRLLPAQEMRLRIGRRIRYPDVIVCAAPLEQTTRTLTDAVAIVEVLSDDPAATDRVSKQIDYADVASRRVYGLLEQPLVAATMFRREAGGAWVASLHTVGGPKLPGLDVAICIAHDWDRLGARRLFCP